MDGEQISLLKGDEAAPQYGTVPTDDAAPQPTSAETRRRLLFAGLKMALLFVVSTALLLLTLKLALPTLEEEDRQYLHVPRTFEQLQQLNTLLKKYRSMYPFRIVLCFVITYLFLQAFSLPGSMYMSILAGAVWGPAKAIPLCCTCVACGATLCYFIGAALGPALLVLPSWKARLDHWSVKINQERANLIPFLIVLRIAPFPPHWVVNVLCPHLGIGLVPFFISTWLGILGVTVIHTTIGGGLDQMTSAADFHLISWRNFLGLSAVVVAVMIPVGIRWYFRKELQTVAEVEAEAALESEEPQEPDVTKSKRLPPGPITVFESEDEAYFTPADVAAGIDRKGKGVDKKDWLMESDDDEPLPPPPSRPPRSSSDSDRSSLDMRQQAPRTSSSSSSSSAKGGGADPKVLG
ncbi:hypothetical protein M407DRAFT_240633 [Tulasnella calospora MUT 4182]|uniref:VTT domain-containing protein n=1 Tax=Tulasnella calospora MUT 4182 TaxID=1051891 RepID=A0A0C3QYH2_9AGAM|nr:hypothetical protein M407DRAFT_240633 [Tulasnella calospora MUT 4182]